MRDEDDRQTGGLNAAGALTGDICEIAPIDYRRNIAGYEPRPGEPLFNAAAKKIILCQAGEWQWAATISTCFRP